MVGHAVSATGNRVGYIPQTQSPAIITVSVWGTENPKHAHHAHAIVISASIIRFVNGSLAKQLLVATRSHQPYYSMRNQWILYSMALSVPPQGGLPWFNSTVYKHLKLLDIVEPLSFKFASIWSASTVKKIAKKWIGLYPSVVAVQESHMHYSAALVMNSWSKRCRGRGQQRHKRVIHP